MKKIFTLFLAFTLLFLTACNAKPPTGTDTGGQTTSGTTNGSETPAGENWLAAVKGQVVDARSANELIDLPSNC